MADAIGAGVAAGMGVGLRAVAVGLSGAVAAESFDFIVSQPVASSSAAVAAIHKTRTSFFAVFIRRSPGGLTAVKADRHADCAQFNIYITSLPR
jgi:hypothetical protein